MIRSFAAFLLAALVFARPAATQDKRDPFEHTTFKLTTTPAPAPGLTTEFRVRSTERQPGNAALDYYRAAMLMPEWPRDLAKSQQLRADIDRWLGAKLDEFPDAEATAYLKEFDAGFDALDAGTRRDTVDWRQGVRLEQSGIGSFLREIQKFRDVVNLNRLRVRRDLARNEFDDAAFAIRSGFRLGKAIGEGPVTIQMLVGVSICAVTWGDAVQFVGRPKSPNLYWALASLPRPLIDPRPALEGEEEFMERGIRAQVGFPKETADTFRTLMVDIRRAYMQSYPKGTAELDKIAGRVEELKKGATEPSAALIALAFPAMRKCYYAVSRVDRQIAGLMAVEAVRLHAAGTKGAPPAALTDIGVVPVPPDPFTGQPFEYAARPDGFTLTAAEDPAAPGSGFRFVVTFRR